MFSLYSTLQCCSYKLLYLHVCDILYFILRNPYIDFQDYRVKISQVQKISLQIMKWMMRLKMRMLRQKKKKKADESTYETEEEPTTETESEDENPDNHQPRR